MVNKLRTTVLFVFAAYIAFIIAGFSLTGLVDDSQFVHLMKSNPALSALWTTIQAGSVIGLLSIVVGGAPLAWTIIHRAMTSQRRDMRLLWVPLVSFLSLVLYFFTVAYLANRTHFLDQPSIMAHPLMWGLITLFILGAIASTVAVWKLVSHTDVEQEAIGMLGKSVTVRIYEFTFIPAVIATLSMVVMFLATLLWGWLSNSLQPDLFTGNMGVMMTNTRSSFAFTLTLMAIATCLSILGVVRGRTSHI